jgi:hypothetical protein
LLTGMSVHDAVAASRRRAIRVAQRRLAAAIAFLAGLDDSVAAYRNCYGTGKDVLKSGDLPQINVIVVIPTEGVTGRQRCYTNPRRAGTTAQHGVILKINIAIATEIPVKGPLCDDQDRRLGTQWITLERRRVFARAQCWGGPLTSCRSVTEVRDRVRNL